MHSKAHNNLAPSKLKGTESYLPLAAVINVVG